MEARIYFNEKSVLYRLEKARIIKKGQAEAKIDYDVNHIGSAMIIREDETVYAKFNTLICLEIPQVLKGLKPKEVTIFDTLSKEENLHIKQGFGSVGKATYSVSYGDDRFYAPSGNQYTSAYGFRSVIKIRVRSSNLQSALDCYKKIREGTTSNNWKGEICTPSHCGLHQNLNLEEIN